WVADETLLAFLVARGDINRDLLPQLEGKLPSYGRFAGAALIAKGHLGQEDLWPVLRAHAEWIIGRALLVSAGSIELEAEPPARLTQEPNVFGGATGAEVLIESIRRVFRPEAAMARLGGPRAKLSLGPRQSLLSECALRSDEMERIRSAQGRSVGELCDRADPEMPNVLYALACLGVLEILKAVAPAREEAAREPDPYDEEAVRQRVRARLALVEDGDYFALLGVPRGATSYEIRRAYLELRRAFEPSRLLTAATAELHNDVQLILQVLDEAFEILREPRRRDRYRRAIESSGPA
ncbi:MAG: J domain-containing protein, partial [Polyangiaceae bacterium]|nr:J domain-containing protein [Polyangiaceae bacterium]